MSVRRYGSRVCRETKSLYYNVAFMNIVRQLNPVALEYFYVNYRLWQHQLHFQSLVCSMWDDTSKLYNVKLLFKCFNPQYLSAFVDCLQNCKVDTTNKSEMYGKYCTCMHSYIFAMLLHSEHHQQSLHLSFIIDSGNIFLFWSWKSMCANVAIVVVWNIIFSLYLSWLRQFLLYFPF